MKKKEKKRIKKEKNIKEKSLFSQINKKKKNNYNKKKRKEKETKNAFTDTKWRWKKRGKEKVCLWHSSVKFAKISEGTKHHCKGFCRLWKLVGGKKFISLKKEDIMKHDGRHQQHKMDKTRTGKTKRTSATEYFNINIVSQEKLKTKIDII